MAPHCKNGRAASYTSAGDSAVVSMVIALPMRAKNATAGAFSRWNVCTRAATAAIWPGVVAPARARRVGMAASRAMHP